MFQWFIRSPESVSFKEKSIVPDANSEQLQVWQTPAKFLSLQKATTWNCLKMQCYLFSHFMSSFNWKMYES